MSDAADRREELEAAVEDRLGDHTGCLERLAEMDTDLSDDARQALEIIEDGGGQS